MKLSCSRKRLSLWFLSSGVAVTNGILFCVIGVRDRESSLTTWAGLRTLGVNSYEPITVWGSATYIQWQGLGNRLPLYGNGSSAPLLFLSRFLELRYLHLVLLVTITLVGVHAFYSFVTENQLRVTARLVLFLCCFAAPLIGVSLRYTVLNDWFDGALTFWASLGLFSSFASITTSCRNQRPPPNHIVPTLAVSFWFISIGNPFGGPTVAGAVFLVLILLGTPVAAFFVLNHISIMEVAVLVGVTAAFLAVQFGTIFDLLSEFLIQQQFYELARASRYEQLSITKRFVEFLVRQSGIGHRSELGFTGLSIWFLLAAVKKRLPKKLVLTILIMNAGMVLDSELARIPLLSSVLGAEPFSYSEWVLIGNLLLLGRVFVNVSLEEFKNSIVPNFRKYLTLAAMAPIIAFPIFRVIASTDSSIPRLEDSGLGQLSFQNAGTQLKSGQFIYASEYIHRGFSDDPDWTLGPREAQSAGLVTLNTYSRVRSSHVLVKPDQLFENGVRNNYCIDSWVAGFLQLDAIVGVRFCSKSWETTDLIEINGEKLWIYDIRQEGDVVKPPCPLLELSCREVWLEDASFSESQLDEGEYFLRCKESCVARWQMHGGYSNVLFPLNFDSSLRVINRSGQEFPVRNFHGLLLVEKPPNAVGLESGTVQFKADLRAHLRALTNLLLTVAVIFSIVHAARKLVNERRAASTPSRPKT